MLLNVNQFNSEYGCARCFQKSFHVPEGLGFVQIYLYEANDVPKARNDELARKQAQQAHVEEKEIFGVKGPSPLMCLPDFDFIDGFVVDSMHCIKLGVWYRCGLIAITMASLGM